MRRTLPDERDAVDVLTVLDEATAEVRRLVHDLRPPMLDDLGMATLCATCGSSPRAGPAVRGRPGRCLHCRPRSRSRSLYRIATEAVHNVVWHAWAGRCTVRVAGGVGAVRLDVTDDGTGCPPSSPPGVGRRAMRERAQELGGELHLGLVVLC